MSLFWWGSVLRLSLASLGRSKAPLKCQPPVGNCKTCGKKLEWIQGIFCANFSSKYGPWSACRNAWCGKCYTLENDLGFHIAEKPENYPDPEHEVAMDAKWRRNQKARKDLYLVDRRGDHLMISFECDLFIFHKLRDQSAPDLSNPNPIDSLLMLSIRRMNLYPLWSRASVEGNAGVVDRGLRHSKLLGLTGPYLATGPLPYHDHCGYEVALQLLTDSRESGSYQLTHKQFDTIHNLRSAYSNQVISSAQVASHPMALDENQGKRYTRFAEDPT
jgi:hypothetical protein